MSETPETDAAWDKYINPYTYSAGDLRILAERLERERDEWAAMCGRYKQERDIAEADATNFHARIFELINERDKLKQILAADSENVDAYLGVCIERDEAREKYDTLAVENMLEVNKLCKERDETMDQLIHLRSCVYDVIHSLKAGAFDELEKAWKEGLK
jgi:hypothetical protein